jgi:hypothetical protein
VPAKQLLPAAVAFALLVVIPEVDLLLLLRVAVAFVFAFASLVVIPGKKLLALSFTDTSIK